jgi:hypothetical protein
LMKVINRKGWNCNSNLSLVINFKILSLWIWT